MGRKILKIERQHRGLVREGKSKKSPNDAWKDICIRACSPAPSKVTRYSRHSLRATTSDSPDNSRQLHMGVSTPLDGCREASDNPNVPATTRSTPDPPSCDVDNPIAQRLPEETPDNPRHPQQPPMRLSRVHFRRGGVDTRTCGRRHGNGVLATLPQCLRFPLLTGD
jgi:hypothetical protein